MSQRILVNIDVTKIDKARLIMGAKGTYCDLILIPTPNNKFGEDFLVKQQMPFVDGAPPAPVIGNARYQKQSAAPIPF